MANKRKKLARSISEKTGLTYAGAINHLNRRPSRAIVSSLEEMFVRDTLPEGAHLVYDRWRVQVDFFGDCVLSIRGGNATVVPMVPYQADYVNQGGQVIGYNEAAREQAIRDRQEALLNCIMQVQETTPVVAAAEVPAYFEKHFEGVPGVLRVFFGKDYAVGAIDFAGARHDRGDTCGLVAFTDTPRAVRLGPGTV